MELYNTHTRIIKDDGAIVLFAQIEKEVKYFNIAKERIENFESLMLTDW